MMNLFFDRKTKYWKVDGTTFFKHTCELVQKKVKSPVSPPLPSFPPTHHLPPPTSHTPRRQRSVWRHEQQSIAMALAAATHHGAQLSAAPRGQKTGTRDRESLRRTPPLRDRTLHLWRCGQKSCWTLSRRAGSWRRHEPHLWTAFRPLSCRHSRVRLARPPMQAPRLSPQTSRGGPEEGEGGGGEEAGEAGGGGRPAWLGPR